MGLPFGCLASSYVGCGLLCLFSQSSGTVWVLLTDRFPIGKVLRTIDDDDEGSNDRTIEAHVGKDAGRMRTVDEVGLNHLDKRGRVLGDLKGKVQVAANAAFGGRSLSALKASTDHLQGRELRGVSNDVVYLYHIWDGDQVISDRVSRTVRSNKRKCCRLAEYPSRLIVTQQTWSSHECGGVFV